jgi:hypothetical protein
MLAHHFSNAPAHAIAHHGISQGLLDAEAETRLRQIVRAKEDREVGTGAALARPINGVKIIAADQPRLARELRTWRRGAGSA